MSHVKAELTRIANDIEKTFPSSRYGDRACSFCGQGSYADIEHTDKCPIGRLWKLINVEVQ